jgi:hypothetical protein
MNARSREPTMMKSYCIAAVTAFLICGPSMAYEKSKKKSAKSKVETGASCKAPAVGPCAACSITCRPGESATCAPGQIAMDACHIQPACKCAGR